MHTSLPEEIKIALAWWSSLSINEQKGLEDKHFLGMWRFLIYGQPTRILTIYKLEFS